MGKGIELLGLTIVAALLIVAIVSAIAIGVRATYRYFCSDDEQTKREIRALIDELKEIKNNA